MVTVFNGLQGTLQYKDERTLRKQTATQMHFEKLHSIPSKKPAAQLACTH